LSPEYLTVFIAPSQVLAVRSRGTNSTSAVSEKRVFASNSVPDDNAWIGSVAAFDVALRELPCRRVRVILSSHFTQYQLLPWRADLNDEEEELAYARVALAETYGDVVAGWSVRLSDDPPGAVRVVAAVDNALLAALQKSATATNARVVSVQPALTAATNSWREHFGADRSAWLVVHEEGRLCLALIEAGQWRWLRSVRVGADWAENLPELIEREVLLAGVESMVAEVLVFAPASPELAVRAGTRLPFRSLRLEARDGFSPLSDGPFGLALIG
jgi:hypothetical protein